MGDVPRGYDTYMNAPLQYWWRGGLIALFGDGLWVMRIHSALFGLATVLMTYRLVHHIRGRRAAFLAALINLTTFQFVFLHSARTGENETALCFLFVTAAYLFIRAEEDPRRGWVLHHLCFFGILNLKLPVVLIPTAAELACFALSANARAQFSRWLWTGVALLPVGLSWHLYQAASRPDEFLQVMREMQSQASSANRLGRSRGGLSNLQRYAPVLLFGAFPYVLAYPVAVIALAARYGRELMGLRPVSREAAGIRTLMLYFIAVFGFYILIAKRGAWYPMPAYPFLSGLVGIWLADLSRKEIGKPMLGALALMASLLLWLRPEMGSFNPFARPALTIPMRTGWAGSGGPEVLVGVLLSAGLIFAGLYFAQRRWDERFAPAVSG
jgi:4-amino-4-deoxy-L-arabinose transferase-like glycosyltransferase